MWCKLKLWVVASLVCVALLPVTVWAQKDSGGGGGAGGSVSPPTAPPPVGEKLTNPFDAGQYAGKDKLPEWAKDPILESLQDGELPRQAAKMTLVAALDSLHAMVSGKRPYPFDGVKLAEGQSVTVHVISDCPDVRFHIRLAGPLAPAGSKSKTYKVTVSVDKGESRTVVAKPGKDLTLTLRDKSTILTGKPSLESLDVPMNGSRPVAVTITVDAAPAGWVLADLRASRPPSAESGLR